MVLTEVSCHTIGKVTTMYAQNIYIDKNANAEKP